MLISFTLNDVLFMSNSSCQNFYDDQRERFEDYSWNISTNYVWLEDKPKASESSGTMFFYDSETKAIIAFKVLSSYENCILFWDLGTEQWGIACSMNWKQYMDGKLDKFISAA